MDLESQGPPKKKHLKISGYEKLLTDVLTKDWTLLMEHGAWEVIGTVPAPRYLMEDSCNL
jgi:hypothetical protein